MDIIIEKSTKPGKKMMAKVHGKTIHFGQKGAADFTTHGDRKRKENYIKRHRGENWGKTGTDTAGFYAKHVLWNKPTVAASVRDLNARFSNISFALKKNN